MTPSQIKMLKAACYTTNVGQSIVANLAPVLFLTFRSLYGISYSLLGLLVLINFSAQLLVDLIFSFFSHKFNIPLSVKISPVLTAAGLAVYAIWPFLFPDHVYLGLVIGTVIFAISGGLVEVLISPVIAEIPSDDPDREMSKLHSVYAWGVVGVIVFCTLFLRLFGQQSWQWMVLILTLIPLLAVALFACTPIPEMKTPEKTSGALKYMKNGVVWLCFFAIFVGGACEQVMAQWSSGYLEQAMNIPKVWGDILGVAMFAVMLGLGRTLYAKYGKNIEKVIFLGAVGSTVCYLAAAVSDIAVVGLISCALTGLCVSMMWPGMLIVGSDRFPQGGVFIFALMASGGDLGASVGPQIVGIVTDAVIEAPYFATLSQGMGITVEQMGLKLGMLVGVLFSLAAFFIYLYILKTKKKAK